MRLSLLIESAQLLKDHDPTAYALEGAADGLASQTLPWLRAAWEVAVVCADADMVGASETPGGPSRLLRIPSRVIGEVTTISSQWRLAAERRAVSRQAQASRPPKAGISS